MAEPEGDAMAVVDIVDKIVKFAYKESYVSTSENTFGYICVAMRSWKGEMCGDDNIAYLLDLA